MPAHDGGRKHAIAACPTDGEERECFVSCGFVGTASPSESGAEDAANMVQVEEEAAESERRRFCVIGIAVVGRMEEGLYGGSGGGGGGGSWGWLVEGARPIIHKSFFLLASASGQNPTLLSPASVLLRICLKYKTLAVRPSFRLLPFWYNCLL